MDFITLRKGQGLVEYALMLVLVSIIVLVALSLLGSRVNSAFSKILDPIGSPSTGPTPEPGDPPPECYSSLLLPIMVSAAGLGAGLAQWNSKKRAELAVA